MIDVIKGGGTAEIHASFKKGFGLSLAQKGLKGGSDVILVHPDQINQLIAALRRAQREGNRHD